MKTLVSCVVIALLFFHGKIAKDFEILQSNVLTIIDTVSKKTSYVLDFTAKVNTRVVTRFALVERQTEKVIYLYNIVEQEDGFYYEGNASYRKMYDGTVAARLRFSESLRVKDLELVYFMGNQKKKLRL